MSSQSLSLLVPSYYFYVNVSRGGPNGVSQEGKLPKGVNPYMVMKKKNVHVVKDSHISHHESSSNPPGTGNL